MMILLEDRLCFGGGHYRNVAFAFATLLETYCTIYQCIESVVRTHAYVVARVVNCTSLTNDDIACLASLTTKDLHA